MPALKPTDHIAEITWIGVVPTEDRTALLGTRLQSVTLGFDGLPGSVHGGETRASCSRVLAQYPKGTTIRNVRQLSLVSEEEIAQIAAAMDLEPGDIDPARLGASLVLRGIPDFSHVPPSSRLQAPNGTTLTVDMENRPCHLPTRSLETVHPGKGKRFKEAAQGLRGITAWVERPGDLKLGDTLRLHVPDQPAWTGGT